MSLHFPPSRMTKESSKGSKSTELKAVVLKSSVRFAQITGEQMSTYNVPADVPNDLIDTYIQNMNAATAGTGKMNLFACDQKIEHLNDDFYDGGKKIPAT